MSLLEPHQRAAGERTKELGLVTRRTTAEGSHWKSIAVQILLQSRDVWAAVELLDGVRKRRRLSR
jgi:hypothetical protein